MKKFFSILLVLAAVTGMCACSTGYSETRPYYGDYSNYPNQSTPVGNNTPSSNSRPNNNEYEEVKSHCERLISQGDSLSAYIYINEKASKDSKYSSLLQKYARIYVDDSLKKAKNYADDGSYQQAIFILEEANKVYYCNEFSNKIEDYKSHLPQKLSFCHIIDSEDYRYMLNAEDCFGNKYQEVFGFNDSLTNDAGGYAIFYLNGKYSNLSGIFVGSNELFKDMEVQCKIYADGKIIYESPKLGKTSPPVNINLDIAGTIQLRVEYMYFTWWTTDPCCIFDLTAS